MSILLYVFNINMLYDVLFPGEYLSYGIVTSTGTHKQTNWVMCIPANVKKICGTRPMLVVPFLERRLKDNLHFLKI